MSNNIRSKIAIGLCAFLVALLSALATGRPSQKITPTISPTVTGWGQGDCFRWNNQLSCTEVLGHDCQSVGDTREYYKWLYSDTAQQACEKNAFKTGKMGSVQAKHDVGSSSADQYGCHLNGSRTSWVLVYRQKHDRQPCCNAQVEGVYGELADDWVMRVYYLGKGVQARPMTTRFRGVEFDRTTQTPIIRAENKDLNLGQLKSDAWGIPGSDEPCLDLIDPAVDDEDDCSAEVHHIIPRRDIKGCLCGRNSYKNGALVSRKLNSDMSNDCDDPQLQAILQYYMVQQTSPAMGNVKRASKSKNRIPVQRTKRRTKKM